MSRKIGKLISFELVVEEDIVDIIVEEYENFVSEMIHKYYPSFVGHSDATIHDEIETDLENDEIWLEYYKKED